MDAASLRWEGRGEEDPRYSNDTEEDRSRNRRVDISFTAEDHIQREVPVGEGEPVKEWGDIFEQRQRFFTEVISIDLHRKNDKLLLWLNSLKRARYLQCARLRDQLRSHAFRIPVHYAWT